MCRELAGRHLDVSKTMNQQDKLVVCQIIAKVSCETIIQAHICYCLCSRPNGKSSSYASSRMDGPSVMLSVVSYATMPHLVD